MRWSALLVVICSIAVTPSDAPQGTGGDALEKARREFTAAVLKAQKDYDATVHGAADRLRPQVQAALERATKEHRLDLSKSLIAELHGLGAAALPVFGGDGKVAPGTWRVAYHPNGVTRTYVVTADGAVSCAEGALRGRIRRDGADMFLDLDDGKLERITFAGGRMFVEHFNPKTSFPQLAEVGIGESIASRK